MIVLVEGQTHGHTCDIRPWQLQTDTIDREVKYLQGQDVTS